MMQKGLKFFNELKVEYLEKYMPKADADPHGGIEDFEKLNDPNICIPGGEDSFIDNTNLSNKDEMV